MNVSGIVDITIVLCVVYLALSVIVSHVNEVIASGLNLRGRMLYAGVYKLLGSSAPLAEAVFAHPLVSSTQGKFQSYPTYIDARTFSTALWHSVLAHPTAAADPGAVAAVTQAAATPEALIGDLKQATENLPSSAVRTQLNALLTSAGSDYNALLGNTDAWFNHQMDRVSGWYRRLIQWIITVITVVIVCCFGIDSVRIVTRLTADSQLRTTLSSGVVEAVHAAPGNVPQQCASAQSETALPGTLTGAQTCALLAALDGPAFRAAFIEAPWEEKQWGNGTHWLGLFITIFAATLGAPFWFDVLMRIVNVRLAGPKPSGDATTN